MNDLTKTIKHFQSLQKRYTTQHNGVMCERVADALEALEKQVAKPPIKKEITNYFAYRRFVDLKCPNCGGLVATKEDEFEFCPDCGQAIDRSNENN